MIKEILFEIAKIIDNEYIGKERTFQANRHKAGYWWLSSGKCDMSGFIKVWEKNNKVSSVEYLGPDDEDWRPITNHSWARIEKYLDSLNTPSPTPNLR